MSNASSETGALVQAQLQALGIDTDPEVKDFRIPGERWDDLKSVTAGDMFTVLENMKTIRGKAWQSRKRVRHDALKLLNQGTL